MAYRRKNGNKYNNKKVEVDGIIFDSKREAERYQELSLLEKAGVIRDLQRQVKYILIPAQREPDIIGKRGGIKSGRVIEKSVLMLLILCILTKKSRKTLLKIQKDSGLKITQSSVN